MSDFDKVSLVLRSGGVRRWHREAFMPAQSVAEHTWRAMVIADLVFHVNEHVLYAILYHDIEELFTGDVPATVKWHSPELKRTLDLLGRGWLERQALPRNFELSDDEGRIAKFCDWIEAAICCLEERKRGNQEVFDTFYRLMHACQDIRDDIADKPLSEKARKFGYAVHTEWRRYEMRPVPARKELSYDD